ncbi:MAG: Rpn family recombination-promoting nuclease/putative transposase [Prevotella sp.]|nr:Rpn family recombination-promoting nuclease/putative transposase [Prevotella sp.]
MSKYIRFDWAMKRLLRNKANYVVLEGFLSVLLEQKIKIHRFLESEGNQEDGTDKYNRVDIMCEDEEGRKLIIEVQNERQYAYFYRMLYGVSKVITDYMERGEDYDNVAKVFSINIVYFDLGQGTDYVYRGRTDFRGLHDGDVLKLSDKQRKLFGGDEPADLMPEYFVLKVNNFNKVAKESLDQWISFLKTGDIPEDFTAQGLPEARERLRVDSLPENERRNYYRELERRMIENDVTRSYYVDGKADGIEEGKKEGREEGKKERELEIARNLKGKVPVGIIIESTGLTAEEIEAL